ncbi:phage tail domain protein [Olsenella profusa]|uniref:Phage tail domain protein n=1 Tax=Olsenella profusa F0195 TaxID=1125712 RepID=U2VB84_9ACTN|nr:phage tail domain protein [Olsenella profusa]ERL09841.1 phage tail domain protein [Olsenella profusa F0195]
MLIILSADGLDDVTIHGAPVDDPCLVATDDTKGWYSHPDLKVPSVARGMGDGDFDVEDAAVLYGPRTVTIGVAAVADDRDGVLSLMGSVNAMAHRNVRIRVIDDGSSAGGTWSVGYLRAMWDKLDEAGSMVVGSITVVCPDPRRLSTTVRTGRMLGGAASTMGLVFDAKGSLSWPVSFGGSGAVQSLCVIGNRGTSTAWPTIAIGGSSPNGWAVTDVATGEAVSSRQDPVWNPIVLDCMRGTARQGGVDVTRRLDSRRFPSVGPGGTLQLALEADAGCTCEVTCYDTYV